MPSEITQFITPDGLVYNFRAHDKIVLDEEGLGMPPVEYITQASPYQHGEVLIDYRVKPRTIQFTHARASCDRQDYWDDRDTFLNIFRPNRLAFGQGLIAGTFRKIRQDGSKRDLKVVLTNGLKFRDSDAGSHNTTLIQESLQFTAYDPFVYDPNIVTKTWAISSTTESMVFPWSSSTTPIVFGTGIFRSSISFTYAGNWPTNPMLRLTGPISGPKIKNTSLGLSMFIRYNVSIGDYIDIDFDGKTIVNSSGVNLIGFLTDDSEDDFQQFHIAPDPEIPSGYNTIYIEGQNALIGTTAACMTYYNRYIGF